MIQQYNREGCHDCLSIFPGVPIDLSLEVRVLKWSAPLSIVFGEVELTNKFLPKINVAVVSNERLELALLTSLVDCLFQRIWGQNF